MAFLAVGAISLVGGWAGRALLRRRPARGREELCDPSSGTPARRAACAGGRGDVPPAAARLHAKRPRGGEPGGAGEAPDSDAAASQLQLWEPHAQAAPPGAPAAEAQAHMQALKLWSITHAHQQLAAERAALAQHLVAALGGRQSEAPVMHLSLNINNSSESTTPAPPPVLLSAQAATTATAQQPRGDWRAALLRAAVRALATVVAWEAGKLARRRTAKPPQQSLLMLGASAIRRASPLFTALGAPPPPRRGRGQQDEGGTHKFGLFVL